MQKENLGAWPGFMCTWERAQDSAFVCCESPLLRRVINGPRPGLNRVEIGGRDRDRTCDPYHVKVVLYR